MTQLGDAGRGGTKAGGPTPVGSTRRAALAAGAGAVGVQAACGQGSGTPGQFVGGGATTPATVRFAADKPRLDAGVQAVQMINQLKPQIEALLKG